MQRVQSKNLGVATRCVAALAHAPHPAPRLAGPASRDGLRTSCASALGSAKASVPDRPLPSAGSAGTLL